MFLDSRNTGTLHKYAYKLHIYAYTLRYIVYVNLNTIHSLELLYTVTALQKF